MRWPLASLILAAACGGAAVRAPGPARDAGRIVITERTRDGLTLALLGEDGIVLGELTAGGAGVPVVDRQAVWSPDGRFIVFVSSRGRASLRDSSLWVVEAVPGARPRRLTTGAPVDLEPSFSPDGTALVFSSNRAGGFDLWRLALGRTREGWPEPTGAAVRLTFLPGDERSPAWSPDGDAIAFVQVTGDDDHSALWVIDASGGALRQLSPGPHDASPAWSPDGQRLAFAAPAAADRGDADLHVMEAGGGGRRVVVSEPLADQIDPRFSADGRFLFATSRLRSVDSGLTVLDSVVVVDLREAEPRLRVLAGEVVTQRMGPALAPEPLQATVLGANEPYDGQWLLRVICERPERPAACISARREERP